MVWPVFLVLVLPVGLDGERRMERISGAHGGGRWRDSDHLLIHLSLDLIGQSASCEFESF